MRQSPVKEHPREARNMAVRKEAAHRNRCAQPGPCVRPARAEFNATMTGADPLCLLPPTPPHSMPRRFPFVVQRFALQMQTGVGKISLYGVEGFGWSRGKRELMSSPKRRRSSGMKSVSSSLDVPLTSVLLRSDRLDVSPPRRDTQTACAPPHPQATPRSSRPRRGCSRTIGRPRKGLPQLPRLRMRTVPESGETYPWIWIGEE
ncbi:hypothetical protein FA13DRAFT_242875 [Coprinellus micaceus]|uniref:Uncharacterized protein n=1 Tax=Coprinellus micaceus TaxID=71717 RepID=A0A4Y7SEU6_COPMI|nr:hypothetical protein FA13DRAFT_242875 [Coprinellus micaceus]